MQQTGTIEMLMMMEMSIDLSVKPQLLHHISNLYTGVSWVEAFYTALSQELASIKGGVFFFIEMHYFVQGYITKAISKPCWCCKQDQRLSQHFL